MPIVEASAEYKRGNFQAALDNFARATGADADYNRGNALARLGHYQEAIAAYDKSLKENPNDDDARANKAAVEALMKQQQQHNSKQQQQTEGLLVAGQIPGQEPGPGQRPAVLARINLGSSATSSGAQGKDTAGQGATSRGGNDQQPKDASGGAQQQPGQYVRGRGPEACPAAIRRGQGEARAHRHSRRQEKTTANPVTGARRCPIAFGEGPRRRCAAHRQRRADGGGAVAAAHSRRPWRAAAAQVSLSIPTARATCGSAMAVEPTRASIPVRQRRARCSHSSCSPPPRRAGQRCARSSIATRPRTETWSP